VTETFPRVRLASHTFANRKGAFGEIRTDGWLDILQTLAGLAIQHASYSEAIDLSSAGTAIKQENRLQLIDRAAHDWFRFVLSFPPHLVQEYLNKFGAKPGHRVLDPFCGTGTTLVECKKQGFSSFGVDSNPMAWFASSVKTDWSVDPIQLMRHAKRIAEEAAEVLQKQGFDSEGGLPLFRSRVKATGKMRTLPAPEMSLLLKNSISPLPLHRVLVLMEAMENRRQPKLIRHLRLALAKSLVSDISNLHFGPEVGVGKPKADAPVLTSWLNNVKLIADDLAVLHDRDSTPVHTCLGDARALTDVVAPKSIDVVITSPPYPNEKDYTRTTRLESVLLGFLHTKKDLRALKQDFLRSNTRGVFKADRDDEFVLQHKEIQRIACEIETRRVHLGKTSGFERLYPRVTKLYFGGMLRHLSELRRYLRPGARLAYVVGDQASYLRVMIRTGQLLADIAASLGYEVVSIDLFRTRLATATRAQLREEIVVLRWPGGK
jgi:hypothetical protein